MKPNEENDKKGQKKSLPIFPTGKVIAFLKKTAAKGDNRTFAIDPFDRQRVVVANQKIVLLKNPPETDDLVIKCQRLVNKQIEEAKLNVRVLRRSPCNPELVLLEADGLHFVVNETGSFQVTPADGLDWQTPEGLASNVVHLHPDQQTPPPTRDDDDGTLPPVRDPFQPLTEYWLEKARQHNDSFSGAPVVAIFDSGIDVIVYHWNREPNLPARYPAGSDVRACPLWYNNKPPTCTTLGTDRVGWNFVNYQRFAPGTCADPFDDNANAKHGTRIAAIIAKETAWNVRIMSLKTHDYRGVGEHFDIFCALEYVLHRSDVRVINASWGHYGASIPLMETYLCKLADNNIWLIASAGNRNDFGTGTPTQIGEPGVPASFHYPACYSTRPGMKVITVTTVSKDPSLPAERRQNRFENYSNVFVDVAVAAGDDGKFAESLGTNPAAAGLMAPRLSGSSYATAYFTGRVAFHLFNRGADSQKSDIVNALTRIDPNLGDVLGGRYCEAERPALAPAG
ncbi:MAG: S8 family serine peptidase [Cytophagaceae bacterium]|nr:S8 family serine peptidase [Cytophagaceae bacterium]